MKCNLDCSYCPTPNSVPVSMAYHDNTVNHPDLDQCLSTIDFMYAYVDLYMRHKPRWNRSVVLNIYGGESLFHPDIEKILSAVKQKHQPYQDSWPLTVTCTTNGVVGPRLLNSIVPLVDEFTVSYHAESLPKQKQQVLDTLQTIANSGRRLKCVVLMHGDEQHWPELQSVIDFCAANGIKYLPRHLDGHVNANYGPKQIQWFQNLWAQRSPQKSNEKQKDVMRHKQSSLSKSTTLSKVGRACCGGRLMCVNQELKDPIFYIPDNNFHGWKCSVNWYFLYIKQHTGEVYVNKDCRMNFDGTVSPIGSLDQHKNILEWTRKQLADKTMPIITCAKNLCTCGLCAPKAQDTQTFLSSMTKHVKDIEVFDVVDNDQ
jgi:pyruvate-formate lyase-activating enzyme